jgi:hypothetical protein
MRTLIVGNGEVGKALAEVLKSYHPDVLDKGEAMRGHYYDVLHVCFPFSEEFAEQVRAYQELYAPSVTVIHSTVPVGTSRFLRALHSPIRGIHPFLTEGIRTFVKLIGGSGASRVADYFRRAGLRVMLFDKQETTELAKILETESYRANIEFCHRAKALSDRYDLSFHEVYTIQAETYNSGYSALGMPEYLRPILQPIAGPIGGHCVLPNAKLLESLPAPLSYAQQSSDEVPCIPVRS